MAYCMPCDRVTHRREGVGPTGRNKQWMIRVDTCGKCGRHYPVNREILTIAQNDWVKRWNTNMGRKNDPLF